MHLPPDDPHFPSDDDDRDPDVRQPPVPPDQAPDVVPQQDPPRPGTDRKPPPMVARPA